MSIARAFTTRRVKQSLQTADLNGSPQQSSRKGSMGSIRHKISSPVELIHTTNMLSYNAPDLYPKTASSTGSSHRSDDDSLSDSAQTSGTTPPTSPDVDSSPKRMLNPKRSLSPEPNHLSAYFTAPSQTIEPASQVATPVVPQRAPSHSKKSFADLQRQRSTSNLSQRSQGTVSTSASYTFSRSSSSSTATSATSQSSVPMHHRAKLSSTAAAAAAFVAASSPQASQRYQHRKDYSESQHPFGPELAQVSEIAEEYGIKEQVNVADAEEREMLNKGLLKFSANDYLGEISGLVADFFGDSSDSMVPAPMAATSWI